MNIFLLRHGITVERDEWDFKSDAKRPLTPDGERQLHAIGIAMKKMGLRFDLILSSPFERAKQTAEIVAKELDLKKRLALSDELRADGEPKKLIREIRKLKPAPENLLLVGHEPYLSGLISVLATGKSRMEIDFKKGGLCKLCVDELDYYRCAVLLWLLTPRQMELMA
ncbi:MAG TPA: phosphohistidine phosphatase SixA [Verrucomicrobiae bacterium]|nr:phosphohistidine phosphatase SixA [Verrucomicrobiae bacterium]